MAEEAYDIEKVQSKIAALLRKAERTDNQAEAEAFSKKAEELLLKWGIDRANLEDKEGRQEEIVKATLKFEGTKGQTRKDLIELAYRVFMGLGNLRAIRTPHFDGWQMSNKVWDLTVVGHKSDVEAAVWLANSIIIQAATAMGSWWRDKKDSVFVYRPPTAAERSKAKSSFMAGYGLEVWQRLNAIRTRVVEEAGTGTDLVLVSRQARVDEFFDAEFSARKSSSGGRRLNNQDMADGARHGRNADLNQTRFRGTAGALRG